MKKSGLVLLLLIAYLQVPAQSRHIKTILRLLPAEKIFGLTVDTRDSLLQGKTYYPAGNDSAEIIAYNFGSSLVVNDYLYVSLSFETGQRASGMVELRSFAMSDGTKLVLVSQTGGVWPANYQQHQLSAFVYTKNCHFLPSKRNLLPAADAGLFLRPGTPAAIKKKVVNNANICFDLSEAQISLGLNSTYLVADPDVKKWLKGDRILFRWINNRFKLSTIQF